LRIRPRYTSSSPRSRSLRGSRRCAPARNCC
jgi:hypothetical protein